MRSIIEYNSEYMIKSKNLPSNKKILLCKEYNLSDKKLTGGNINTIYLIKIWFGKTLASGIIENKIIKACSGILLFLSKVI